MADPKLVGVIQARMGSTRLPGKVLLPLAGAPLLARLVERVRTSHRLERLVVATSVLERDDPIEALCRSIGCDCHRGDEEDVLARMLGAAGDCDALVRLTGDNPFVDGTLVDLVADAYVRERPAYAHNIIDGWPYGLYVEIADRRALDQAMRSQDPLDHEHVTWYLRQHSAEFATVAVRAPGEFAIESLTIDTEDDYRRLSPLFAALHAKRPSFGYLDLLSLHPGDLA